MKRGFTLIELVMVIVILGILAATALPRFIDLSTQAKVSAAKGSLGGIRAAVAIRYASIVVNGGSTFPATIDNETPSLFADGLVPKCPALSGIASESNTVEAVTAAPTGAGIGWAYDSANGMVWINHSNYTSY